MKKLFALVCIAAGLSSCQSNFTYVPIVEGAPNMEMTQARCQILSSSTQTGYIAYGSQAYVAGAGLGNAIGNAIAADQFVQQCMTMNGWRRVPLPAKGAHASAKAPYIPPSSKPRKLTGSFPPAPNSCPKSFVKPVSQMTQMEKAKYGVNKPGC